ncbi:unnamed protein product [Ilex paraguariensis]|uniref:UDP-N-acetylglucosamine transferase subunit ALG14 n=1 Tax=Ilex paraguariensis TaxID=185542 RepID=A0ABC8V422_9AQUA
MGLSHSSYDHQEVKDRKGSQSEDAFRKNTVVQPSSYSDSKQPISIITVHAHLIQLYHSIKPSYGNLSHSLVLSFLSSLLWAFYEVELIRVHPPNQIADCPDVLEPKANREIGKKRKDGRCRKMEEKRAFVSNMTPNVSFLLTIAAVGLIVTRVLYVIYRSGKPLRNRSVKPCRTLIILGSGGHTAEMLNLLSVLQKDWFAPRFYIAAATDNMSLQKARVYEDTLVDKVVSVYDEPFKYVP